MNKKFKIISSLTLAGMMALSPLALSNTFATNIDDAIQTNPAGIYSKLGNVKDAVPFLLVNEDDAVTYKEIANSGKFVNITSFNNGEPVNDNTLVKTGDYFVADGKTYTIVIYGDVNMDGYVNSSDALLLQKYSVDDPDAKLNDVQKVAGNVHEISSDEINSSDALRIKKFAVGDVDVRPLVDPIPTPDQDPAVESNYHLFVGNSKNQVNSKIKASAPITIELDKTLSDAEVTKLTGYTIQCTGVDANGAKKELSAPINVTFEAHKDLITVSNNANFTGFADGTIVATLLDGNNKVVTTQNVTLNTGIPTANVTTNRVDTLNATISFQKYGDSNVVKMYYIVKPVGTQDTTVQAADVLAGEKITVSNNTLTDYPLKGDFTTETAYKIFYVLEDEYGNQSRTQVSDTTTKALSTILSKESTNVKTPAQMATSDITVPDLTKTASAEFSWDNVKKEADGDDATFGTGYTYVATLYKDGKAIATENVTGANGTMTTSTFTAKISNNPGTYYVEVYIDATADSKKSEAQKSDSVTVTALQSVTGAKIVFDEEANAHYLEFTDPNSADDEDATTPYIINLVKMVDDAEAVDVAVTTTGRGTVTKTPAGVTRVKLDGTSASGFASGAKYIAEITVKAKTTQLAKADSAKAQSEEFNYVVVPGLPITAMTPDITSVTIATTGVTAKGKTITYKVVPYIYNDTVENRGQSNYTIGNAIDVTIQNGKIVIPNLKEDTQYAFDLEVYADGVKAQKIELDVIHTLPLLNNITIVDAAAKADTLNKVYSNSATSITRNGKTVNLSTYQSYTYTQTPTSYTGTTANNPILANTFKFINALKVDDVLTVDGTKVSVNMPGAASVASTTDRNFNGVNVSDMDIEITGNAKSKTLKNIAGAKSLTLKGNPGLFTIDTVSVKDNGKMVVTDGVQITSTGDVNATVKASSTPVKINDVKITSSEKDVKVAGTKAQLSDLATTGTLVTVDPTSTDITVEGVKVEGVANSGNFEVKFAGLSDLSKHQTGKTTIIANGGTAIVSAEANTNVGALDLQATNKGKIIIDTTTNPTMTGAKNVTVSKDASADIKLSVDQDIPEILKGLTNYTIKSDYDKDDDMVTALTSASADKVTKENLAAAKAYLDKFNLPDGAVISLSGSTVTIKITTAKAATTIGNIK